MLEAVSEVRIPTPGRYAARIARHFEHRVSVHREEAFLRIHFPDATCEMRPGDDLLHIFIQSHSRRSLTRCRDVVARHLKQVAGAERFVVAWSGDLMEFPGTESIAIS